MTSGGAEPDSVRPGAPARGTLPAGGQRQDRAGRPDAVVVAIDTGHRGRGPHERRWRARRVTRGGRVRGAGQPSRTVPDRPRSRNPPSS